ncbi:hypothetical protein DL546_002325 [Coniochaeta pulveracea]|uniref:Uncharacterized protein n=1 Tax=Coniochaeta pulveracea TaxID=177199 RepID=A0A420YF84_9PEZI|nr:hypothetical protein DL546_002325 [Coniochaeta pulveracea]
MVLNTRTSTLCICPDHIIHKGMHGALMGLSVLVLAHHQTIRASRNVLSPAFANPTLLCMSTSRLPGEIAWHS